jgi:hypothetical protein
MEAVVYVLAGISALGGLSGIGSFLLWRSTQKKVNSEAEKLLSEGRKNDVEGDVVMTDKALIMYEAMVIRAQNAEKKADDADKKASLCLAGTYELIDHIYLLRRKMSDHGIEPPPFRFPASITGSGGI